MPTIELTQGQRARVDWQDYRELMNHKWCAHWDPKTKSFYAKRVTPRVEGKQRLVQMHRQLLGLVHGDGKHVDHRNHDTLDNRRRNIRVVTVRENAENQRNQSVHGVGVYKRNNSRCKPFCAQAEVDGRLRHLGRFATAEEAMDARKRFLRSPEVYPLPRRRASPHGTGITERESGRFMAWVMRDGKATSIGTFATAEEAREARRRFLEGQP